VLVSFPRVEEGMASKIYRLGQKRMIGVR
jgi:hypothetical protein